MITKDLFIELIKKDYPELYLDIIDGLQKKRYNSFRVNTLKTTVSYVLNELDKLNIKYRHIDISPVSFLIDLDMIQIKELDLYKNGYIYMQSISSQIPPLLMDLDSKMDILDMCAAPGGKTSMISSLASDANILALEENKIRFERLKHNLSILECKNVTFLNQDSRKLDSFFRFDSILLDAPCSGSGTINLNDENGLKSFSTLLVKNSSKVQTQLLKKAIEILKPGKTLIYSTCSILKEENEDVLNKVLNNNIVIENININIDESNLLPSKIKGVLTIKPSEVYEGFFVAKIKKLR